MTDSEKLEEVRLGVVRLEGAMKTIAAANQRNAEDIRKVEGRLWGLVIMVTGAFGTAIMSIIMAGVQRAGKLAMLAQSSFGWLF